MPMIIKGLRVRSKSGVSRIIRHLKNADENESVVFLRGTDADIRDMQKDASAIGATYSVRHWIVAPHEPMTRPQMRQVLDLLSKEFAFDACRAVVVEHRKKRVTEDAVDLHWHVLVGEVDPDTGRVLRSSFDRVIHELVARVSEYAFGHRVVSGKHNSAVINGLRKRGMGCAADHLERTLLPVKTLPSEAFSHSQHQEKKRRGLDLPALRQVAKKAIEQAASRENLETVLSASGLNLKLGDKPGTWVVLNSADNSLIGALHRLTGKRKAEVNALMHRVSEPVAVGSVPQLPNAMGMKPSHGSLPKGLTQAPALSQYAGEAESAKTGASIVVKVSEQLAELEKAAAQDLALPFPSFKPTVQMARIKAELRQAQSKLKSAREHRWHVHSELSKAPPVRWWCYAIGLAGLRRRQILALKSELTAAEHEQQKCQIAEAGKEAALRREESQAKEQHAKQMQDFAHIQKRARYILQQANLVRDIIADDPKLSSEPLHSLLELARLKLKLYSSNVDSQDMNLMMSI